MQDELYHYGTKRHSGRYPWGSGENPFQRDEQFLATYRQMKKEGVAEKEIANFFGLSVAQLRAQASIAKDEKRAADVSMARRLYDKGYGYSAIGKKMGINESSVRSLLDETIQKRAEVTKATADMLKSNVENKKFIDIGPGTEVYMGISAQKLKTSVELLKAEGYTVEKIYVDQPTTGKKTTVTVLAAPGTTISDIYNAAKADEIKLVTDYTENGGRTFRNIEPIRSVDSNRIYIRYAEDGGINKDGVIELRRNVDDISLGNAKYAQVRIGVDDKYYLKGMALYGNDIPDGYDIVFNTNKHQGTPMEKVLKPMKNDPDNPFGATIKPEEQLRLAQKHYIDINGKEQLSCLNVVREEGDWSEWSKTLASQFLSKQPLNLARKQLDLAYAQDKEEFDSIDNLTNPAVKKLLLTKFADGCDANAVQLKAAALPRQASYVILPIPSLKENEIYAPNYHDGEQVALVRYPHGGIFEIPILTVKNKNKEANSVMQNAKDAVGINPKAAAQLSGADFDGDTVLVIPTKNQKISSKSPLAALKDFDPKEAYPAYEGMKVISPSTKQKEMGKVSNLITDMTLKGASDEELARAVKHSMVVIDAEKHKLNYKQSEIDNGIDALKRKYQSHPDGTYGGASTLISKAKSPVYVNERRLVTKINKETGEKEYLETGKSYTKTKIDKKTGEVTEYTVTPKQTSTQMAETKDAMTLSSGTPMENLYANYANKEKALANQARKAYIATPSIERSPSAAKAYAAEVSSLEAKLNTAKKNKPLERQATIRANKVVAKALQEDPHMDAEHVKKLKGQALSAARYQVGADKKGSIIHITPNEWKAIQSGALSNNKVLEIFDLGDLDEIKSYATPRSTKGLSSSQISLAKSMSNSGYTTAEIADRLGVSTTTVNKYVS